MLKITPLQLIQFLSNNLGEGDIYTLAKYISGTETYNSAAQVASKVGFELEQIKPMTRKPKTYKRLIHHESIPCGTSSVYPLKVTEMPHEITCTKCKKMMRLHYEG